MLLALIVSISLAVIFFSQRSTITSLQSTLESKELAISSLSMRVDSLNKMLAVQNAAIDTLSAQSERLKADALIATKSNARQLMRTQRQLRTLQELSISNECQPALDVLKSEAQGLITNE
jgi:predicted RNase H-like nuclease (RuvC/YqgF family)